MAELDEVESAVFSELPEDTCVVCDVALESTEESVVDSDVWPDTAPETDGVIVRLAGSAPFRTWFAG